MKQLFFFIFCIALIKPMIAENKKIAATVIQVAISDTAAYNLEESIAIQEQHRFVHRENPTENKKLISAILAFPFPFGLVGGHRIYLGTSPIVPIVYIATLGGCFGILPFIDFVVILINKDVKEYINNPKIFMWVKDNG